MLIGTSIVNMPHLQLTKIKLVFLKITFYSFTAEKLKPLT